MICGILRRHPTRQPPPMSRRSSRLAATIVLSMKPELIGREPEDPVAIWKLLSDHFERKTWGNCYELWKRLMTTPRMKEIRDGGSVDKHLRLLQETFDSLAVLNDPVSGKASYVYTRLLAGIVPNDGHHAARLTYPHRQT